MRSLNEIKETILTAIANSTVLQALTTTSKASVWGEWVNAIAYAHFVLEQQFDKHRTELSEMLKNQKKGSAIWYRNMALAFQFGKNLLPDSDIYASGIGLTEDSESFKIIKYAAVTESEADSRLIIKIATENGGVLEPIQPNQLESFTDYIAKIKYAGVKVTVINYRPDILRLKMQIYRNPLVLNENGMSIEKGNYPVQEAIQQYMKELPFDGELVLAHLVDKLQKVEGVRIPHVEQAMSRWIDSTVNDYGDWEEFPVKKIPVSGYFQVENFDNISYVV